MTAPRCGRLAALAAGLGLALAAPALPALAAASAASAAPASATASGGAAGTAVPPLVSPSAPFVLTSLLFVAVPQGPAIRIEELADGENRGAAPVDGLTFPLPPGAVGAALQSGAPAAAFVAGTAAMDLAVTVPAGGTVSYAFTYSVSWAGGRLWLPVAYPTATLLILVPEGRWAVAGAGFAPAGRLPLSGGVSVQAYGTVAPSPGALLPVQLRRQGWWSRRPVRIAIAAAAAAAAAAGAIAAAGRGRDRRAGREAALVEAVASLDLKRAEMEEQAYLDRRQELLEELRALQGSFGFELRAAGEGRLGCLRTPHGDVSTPAFLPVGTQATVKGLLPAEVRATGAQMLLANTYHLWLRPGAEAVAEHGGLHRFMAWDGPILTDSGGFQVWSLQALRRIDEGGVTFRSHLDGSVRRLDPETAVAIQEALGSDIAMVLDECVPYPCARADAAQAVRRTLAWAGRCRVAQRRPGQALFAIVQGGVHTDLRAECSRALVDMDFPGYALGSLSVGEPLSEMRRVLAETVPLLPAGRPRYLMGVGSPDYILEAVWHGIDMFDCVLPTRIARNGTALVLPAGLLPSETAAGAGADLPEGRAGRLVVRNAAYGRDLRPVDASCGCPCCRAFSRAYLRHLFRAGEMLGPRLLSLHNLHTLARFVAAIRGHVAAGTLRSFREAFWERAQPWAASNRP